MLSLAASQLRALRVRELDSPKYAPIASYSEQIFLGRAEEGGMSVDTRVSHVFSLGGSDGEGGNLESDVMVAFVYKFPG